MNDSDKQVVKAAKEFGASDLITDLVQLAERLDKRLTEIVEAGKPFVKILKKEDAVHIRLKVEYENNRSGDRHHFYIDASEISALAQALSKVKND